MSDPDTVSASSPARPERLATALAAAWLALAATDVLLHAAVRATALHDARLPSALRAALVASELLLLGLVVLAVGGPLLMALEALHHGARRAKRLFVRAAVACAAALLLYLFGASWALFASTAHFLDVGLLALWLGDPVQMMQHATSITPWVTIAVPLLALGAGVLGTTWFLAAAARWSHARARGVRLVAVVVLCGCAAAWAVGELLARAGKSVSDPDTGTMTSLLELYRESRQARTGPVVHAAAEVMRRDPPDSEGDVPGVTVIGKRQVPMAQYVGSVDPAAVKPWNVIVILLESLRPDQLRAYGGTRDVMPNLDALAREGVVYTNARCQASFSIYADPCVVSSHYPLRGRSYYRYEPNPPYPRVLLHDVLKAFGRRTGVFSSQNEYWGGMYYYYDTGNVDYFLHAETYHGRTYVNVTDDGFASWVKGKKRAGKILDEATVDEALKWIDAGGPAPFYITMNLQQSHVPYALPKGFPHRFGPENPGFTVSFSFPKDKTPVVKDLYADALFYMDTQLGRLFQHLKDTGAWERTVIVATGDNGEAFYEHGFGAHAESLYDEVVHVPLIVRAPGLAPAVDARPAQHVDVPPTVCDLLGLPPHPSFQGESLLRPTWNPARSSYLVVQLPFAQQYAVVRSGYKLIFDKRANRYLLYDLAHDPGERRDVLAEHPDVAAPLKARLLTWYHAQVDYHEDPVAMSREYPPVLLDD